MNQRNLAYSDIINADVLANRQVVIVGVGAIGACLARSLAAMGCQSITVIDHDTVDESNMGTQGYRPDQIGEPKVMAIGRDMLEINPDCLVAQKAVRWTPEMAFEPNSTIFICVDNMDTRKEIFEAIKPEDEINLIDARMAAEHYVVYSSPHQQPEHLKALIELWYPSSEAYQPRCTARSTLYAAMAAAAEMIAAYRKMLAWGECAPPPFMTERSLLGCSWFRTQSAPEALKEHAEIAARAEDTASLAAEMAATTE